MLSVDDLTSNYVVYCPVSYERQEDDWLLDIELYSESYRTDAVSNWMQELDILDNPSMRKLVKHYRKFLVHRLVVPKSWHRIRYLPLRHSCTWP